MKDDDDEADLYDCDHREEYGRVRKYDGGRMPLLCARCRVILQEGRP